MKNLNQIIKFSGSYKWLLLLSMILSGISAIFLLVPYYSIYQLFYHVSAKHTFSPDFYGLLAIGGIVAGILCYFTALWFSHLVGFRIEKNMRLYGVEKLLDASLDFFDRTGSGKIRKIIDNNAALTHSFVAHNIPDLTMTFVSPIVILTAIFKIDWIIGSISLSLLIASFYLMKLMMGNTEDMKYYMYSLDNMASQAVEYIRGMQVVKIFNASLTTFKKFHKAIYAYSDWALKYSFSARLPFIWNQLLLEALGILLALLGYCYLSQNPVMNGIIINIIFCFIISSQLILFLTKVLYTGENMTLALQAIDQLKNLFPSTEEDHLIQKPITELENFDITVENVSFSYSTDRTILKNIDFYIPKKKITAIIGSSGSGKSTLARLITKMYRNYSGNIFIGGVNIRNISESQLMKWMTFVFQDTKLFKKSILENLLIAKPTATMIEIEHALHETQCDDIIAKLPDGLDTVVGTKNIFLSGGEQQRLALCRAYLKDSPILILDEITASLDSENEFKIKQAIQKLLTNKTVVIIAHKLSLIESADQIIVLDKGSIAEVGNHAQLLKNNGRYKQMIDSQNITKNWKLRGEQP